jgi:hypothetical protein
MGGSMDEELTIDKCVLLHCDSQGEEAPLYREKSIEFLAHWVTETMLVACVNAGILAEYTRLSVTGKQWWAAVIQQSRYRMKSRAIRTPQRDDFCRRQKVPLHGEDFDYVDAASQSNSLLWLSNETNWKNKRYRRRILSTFRVAIQDVNEYMNGDVNTGTTGV